MIPPGFPGEDSTRNAAERDQFRNDLAAVIESPEGFRVLKKIIAGFGAGSYIQSCDAGSAALFNEGERLLREMTEANPAAAIRLIAAIRGIETQGVSNGW